MPRPPKAAALPFTDFLPEQSRLPRHIEIRARLVEVFNSQGGVLPAAESPLGQLWGLLNTDDSSIEQCVEVIRLDPALTAKVFRLANSAAFGGQAKTIAEAVFHLGFAQLRQAAFNAQVFEQFSELQLPPGWEHFWVRNLFIAQLTEHLSSCYFTTNGSEYLAGLLHDVGWLLLVSSFPEEFAAVCASPLPLVEAEIEAFGLTHADISAAICVQSHIPLRVATAVVRHHQPVLHSARDFAPGESSSFLAVLLFLCDHFADCHQLANGGPGQAQGIDEILAGPEGQWLISLGHVPDFHRLVETELAKAQTAHSILFAGT